MRTLIASDWHLGSFSPPSHVMLAQLFLETARASSDRVVLNGDIFEGLFEPVRAATAACPAVRDLIDDMEAHGQLRRTAGNHDPDAGQLLVVLDESQLGRVLVTHGHAVDPLHHSPVGRFGDGISRRFGHLRVVRAAARIAEQVAHVVAGRTVERAFQARCRAMVQREHCALGVFGHIHRAYVVAGDNYANSGVLADERLEYLVITNGDIQLAHVTLDENSSRGRHADTHARTRLRR